MKKPFIQNLLILFFLSCTTTIFSQVDTTIRLSTEYSIILFNKGHNLYLLNNNDSIKIMKVSQGKFKKNIKTRMDYNPNKYQKHTSYFYKKQIQKNIYVNQKNDEITITFTVNHSTKSHCEMNTYIVWIKNLTIIEKQRKCSVKGINKHCNHINPWTQ